MSHNIPVNATTRPAAATTSRTAAALQRIGLPLLLFAIVMGTWAAVSVTIYRDASYILPRPWDVVIDGWANRQLLLNATKITFVESFLGLVAAIVVGVLTAVLMSQSVTIQRSIYPYAILLQTVPVVAIAPIIVLWFGYGTLSVVIVSFIIALFPIINNSLLGLTSVDRNTHDLFRLHQANRTVRLVKLQFPSAMPQFVAGLRISAGLSVVGAIVGEYIIGSGGSQGGLGVKIIFSQGQLDTNLLFAEVIMATTLGFGFFMIVSGLGYAFLRTWHESAIKTDH